MFMLFATDPVISMKSTESTITYATHEMGIGTTLVNLSNQPFSIYTHLIKPLIKNEIRFMQSINVYSCSNIGVFSLIFWLNGRSEYLQNISCFLLVKSMLYALAIWSQYAFKQYYDHHEAILSVYKTHAPSLHSGVVFSPQYPVNNLPSSVKITGFSFFIDVPLDIHNSPRHMIFDSMHQKFIVCCKAKKIVLIATGNDKQNLKDLANAYSANCQFSQEIYSSMLQSAQEQKLVVLISGYTNENDADDGMANHLTPEQIKALKVKYVRAPIRHHVNGKEVGGTSFAQPYVAALLANIMEKHPSQSSESCVEAFLDFTNNNDFKAPMPDNFEKLYKEVDTYFSR